MLNMRETSDNDIVQEYTKYITAISWGILHWHLRMKLQCLSKIPRQRGIELVEMLVLSEVEMLVLSLSK
jgi:hypothetical protein